MANASKLCRWAGWFRSAGLTGLLGVVAVASGQSVERVELLGCDACSAAKIEAGVGAARAMLARATLGAAHPEGDGERALNDTTTDLIKYDLDIAVDPVARTIVGSNVISFVALEPISTVQVRLSGAFAVNTSSGVQVDGVNRSFTRSGVTMTVQLGRTYGPGEAFNVKVTYGGTPTSGGFGSITFRMRGTSPEVFTLSETDFAHTWFPCKENNLDKCVAEMRFTVPGTMRVASNGVLQSVTDAGGGRLKFHWKTDYPTATYLYCFAATDFNEYLQTWNFTPAGGPAVSMPVSFWLYPASDTPSNRAGWFNCLNMLTAFSREDRFGLYPFSNEKYGMYQFGFGGGMEHQTATGQGTFDENVTAHELAHQWWGDHVTCATWNDIWLNEGFATYGEALWLEWRPGSTGAQALRQAMHIRRPADVNGTVWCPTTTDMNRIFSSSFSYRKGGWVLHMLRRVMGDAAFLQALREYRAAYGGGSATTAEFQAVCEAVHGSSLNTFFQQWVFQPGAPAYSYAIRPLSIGGRHFAQLYVSQTQSAAFPTYIMPMDVRVTLLSGGSTLTRVWNDAGAEHFLIPISEAVNGGTIDPDLWILNTGITTLGALPEPPPKVIETVPAPGAAASAGFGGPVRVTFQKHVNISAGDVTLTGPGGSVPASFAYDAGTFTATLTPSGPLGAGSYTLSVAGTVTGVAGGLALDGETPGSAGPLGGGVLPSGDGIAGGAFSISFVVAPPPACVGDLNGDGAVNTADLTLFLGRFGSGVTPGADGDFDVDGVVTTADLTTMLGAFGTGCP